MTTIKQEPSNVTMTASAQKVAMVVKRRGRPRAQPMATCQVLDTIEEVNEDSQIYPDLDFGKTESEAADDRLVFLMGSTYLKGVWVIV